MKRRPDAVKAQTNAPKWYSAFSRKINQQTKRSFSLRGDGFIRNIIIQVYDKINAAYLTLTVS